MSIQTFTVEELLALKPPAWLVDEVLPEQGLIALYGPPANGKSFIALDMALSIASGLPWQGHPVQKGYVVYISAEGGAGLGKRVGAWLQHKQILPADYKHLLLNFVVSAIRIHPESEDLGEILAQTVNDSGYQELLASVLDPDEDAPPLFIIVDTLARCFEGDENQQEDMGAFIRGLDYLREAHTATVLVVHHTNKGELEERGSSAFRGACDTMMLSKKEKNSPAITLSCEKQKDAEPFPDEAYELVVVPKWESCIVQSMEGKNTQDRDNIRELLTNDPSLTVREIASAMSISRSSAHRRILEIRKEQNEPLGQEDE